MRSRQLISDTYYTINCLLRNAKTPWGSSPPIVRQHHEPISQTDFVLIIHTYAERGFVITRRITIQSVAPFANMD